MEADGMRVLLQRVSDGKYYGVKGRWSREHRKAWVFGTSYDAIIHAQERKLPDVQVILKFMDARYDLILPIQPPTYSPAPRTQNGSGRRHPS